MIVVIDGPAGAGKSSTARLVARRAGINYIDSGAIYRGFTLLYLQYGQDREQFFEQLRDHGLRFEFHGEQAYVYRRDEDVSDRIRENRVNDHVSEVAAFPEVREKVNEILRRISRNGDYVAEGRDLGTVVFPDADLKFFMTADLEERARRRLMETGAADAGESEDAYQAVRENLHHRDKVDAGREKDPLKKPEDAIKIDTTGLTFDEQVDLILDEIERIRKCE